MSVGLLGNKIGMTQIFGKKGEVIPVTVIKVGPCFITQIKSEKNCGYNAVQLGYIEISPNSKKLTKPNLGHFTKVGLSPYQYLKEYKVESGEDYTLGQKVTVDMFKIGQKISVTGLSIGKGNGGNLKRNNFSRGPMGHGSKHHRLQGSLGSGTTPGRVFPGKKMPGRLGNQKCTISGLEIIDFNMNESLLVVKGSIPGKSGNLISISVKNEDEKN